MRFKRLFIVVLVCCGVMTVVESGQQVRDARYVSTVALGIVQQARAQDTRSRVIALRDYLRAHIDFRQAPYDDRPFLRASAAETLRSGQGYCGEVTRAFINMASVLGIQAQRINLWGPRPHVVAEVELAPGERVLVDSQNPPAIKDLEPLDSALKRHTYHEYYTLNLRRLHLHWFVSRLRVEMGPLTYWTENPHALKALLWASLATSLVLASLTWRGGRAALRRYLHRRGWVHASNTQVLRKILSPVLKRSTIDEKWMAELRCPGCQGILSLWPKAQQSGEEGTLDCPRCRESFPVVGGIPRMLLRPMRESLRTGHAVAGAEAWQVATARSFGFEWNKFPDLRAEWQQNFMEYMGWHQPDEFLGRRVLDAGCGNGRHAYWAGRYGAEVWAVDLGEAVEVARHNTPDRGAVHVVQADLHHLPFAPESFDFIYSIGVLHHLKDPETGLRQLLRFLKPGGEILVYFYWKPENRPVKSALLAVVSVLRLVTSRLPYGAIYALSFPAACLAFVVFVWPYRLLSQVSCLNQWADRIPMKQYARYPFKVCVNDQFDRFSAPIERRYTRAEVNAMFQRAGLEDIAVWPNCGWGSSGRKPTLIPAQQDQGVVGSVAGG